MRRQRSCCDAVRLINKGKAKKKSKDGQQEREPTLGVFTALSFTAVADYKLKNSWILDSGSDIHVCNKRENCTRTRDATETDILIAGMNRYPIEAFGSVEIRVSTKDGIKRLTLLDVALTPGFMTNLVSLSRLHNKHVNWNTLDGSLTLKDEHLCYVRRRDGHWILSDDNIQPLCPSIAESELAKIFNRKETNHTSLYDLVDMVRGVYRNTKHSSINKASHSAFSATKEDKGKKPECLCGFKHYYSECYYLNSMTRPDGWSPNPDVNHKVQTKLNNSYDGMISPTGTVQVPR